VVQKTTKCEGNREKRTQDHITATATEDEPMPFDLIGRIVKLPVKQDAAKAPARRKMRR
jgi:hypothetical protein